MTFTPTLLHALSASTVLVLVTVMLHYFGIVMLERVLRIEVLEEQRRNVKPFSLLGVAYPVGLVLCLFVLHGLEIWLYAVFYLLVGAINSLETAVYFSTMTYASIGFSDSYIAPAWRVVAGIEGINGLILLGWSTAFFVTFMNKMIR